jgi:hypothetical protein
MEHWTGHSISNYIGFRMALTICFTIVNNIALQDKMNVSKLKMVIYGENYMIYNSIPRVEHCAGHSKF